MLYTPEGIAKLFAYNRWAYGKMFESLGPLSSEELNRKIGGSFGSIHATLVHLYGADWVWLERWRGGCLTALESTTDDNGEREFVRATARGNRLVVARPPGSEEHEGCVRSFAYWNPQILKAQRLLNSQTGELLPVTVLPRGEEPVRVGSQTLQAQRYRISGTGLQIDVWYSGDDWVALEAAAAGGRKLRYELM